MNRSGTLTIRSNLTTKVYPIISSSDQSLKIYNNYLRKTIIVIKTLLMDSSSSYQKRVDQSSSNSNKLTKQVTLNKFFKMPSSLKPIQIQTTVDSLFKKQSLKSSSSSTTTTTSTSKVETEAEEPTKSRNDSEETREVENSNDQSSVSKEPALNSSSVNLEKCSGSKPDRTRSEEETKENKDSSSKDDSRDGETRAEKRRDPDEKAGGSDGSEQRRRSSGGKKKLIKRSKEDEEVGGSQDLRADVGSRAEEDKAHDSPSPKRKKLKRSKDDRGKDPSPKKAENDEDDSQSRKKVTKDLKPEKILDRSIKVEQKIEANENHEGSTSRAIIAEKPRDVKDDEKINKEEEEDEEEEEEEEAEDLKDLACQDVLKELDYVKWENKQPVPYASLAHAFHLIESTTKRLEITKYLSQYLTQVITRTPDELLKVIYLCINRLCPDYEGIELGIGESLLIKAIASSMGRTAAQVKTEYRKLGDLGSVARNSRTTQKTMFKPKLLTVNGVYHDLKAIATISGQSSQTKKVGIITKMLASFQGEEAKYIIRSLEGKLRIGLAERTVLVALATAAVMTGVGNHSPKNKQKLTSEDLTAQIADGVSVVKAVYSEIPSYDLVIPALLKGGIRGLRENCKLTPGVPLKPMLAKPTKAISEVLDRFEGHKFTCEYKYDGERAQIHYLSDGSISIFSRNSENMSVKYPDMVDQLPRAIKKDVTKCFVLDAEAVAWDPISRSILPFQELSRRKRKDVKSEDITVKVHIFAFDLLYLNEEPMINRDFKTRRKLLKDHFEEVEGEFSFAKSVDVENVEDIQTFLDESVKGGCEGLMVKMLDGENATYEPSRRSMNWLKVKKDYLAGVGDSLDLVVIGAYYGRGKRTNVYGAFLLGCYDQESESYQSICKIGTGFSEEDLEKHFEKLKPLELVGKKAYYDVSPETKVDVWFEARIVWEVLAADLSLSPVYSAAKGLCGDGSRGISLRFPRYIRERDDKTPEDSTGPEQVAEMYRRQASVTGVGGGGGNFKKKNKSGINDDCDDDFW